MGIETKIYELRKKAGLSQEELGFILNVTRQTVSKWETGQSLPEIDKVNSLCDYFQISADELLRDQVIEQEKANKRDDLKEIEVRAKKIPYLTLAIFTFIFAVLLIPIMNELRVSSNIEAAIVALVISLSIYFLVNGLKKSKK